MQEGGSARPAPPCDCGDCVACEFRVRRRFRNERSEVARGWTLAHEGALERARKAVQEIHDLQR